MFHSWRNHYAHEQRKRKLLTNTLDQKTLFKKRLALQHLWLNANTNKRLRAARAIVRHRTTVLYLKMWVDITHAQVHHQRRIVHNMFNVLKYQCNEDKKIRMLFNSFRKNSFHEKIKRIMIRHVRFVHEHMVYHRYV